MFDSVKRRHCPFRICNGRVPDSRGRVSCRVGRNNTVMCHICDCKVFEPCATCAEYRECMCDWKDKDVIL